MLSVRKILSPVTFSEQCRGAVRTASCLAQRFQSEWVVLHVVNPMENVIAGPESGFGIADLSGFRKEQANAELEAFLARDGEGAPSRRLVLDGDPSRSVVNFAHDENIDLIVMPTHGYGPFRRFLLGSVTAKVLHDAECPVWTGVHLELSPAAAAEKPLHLQRVMAAVDLGPSSGAVLDWAADLAAATDAELGVVHVVEPDAENLGVAKVSDDLRVHLAKVAAEEVNRLLAERELSARVDIEVGRPHSAVCEVAKRMNADVLVIGRSSESGMLGRLRAQAYAIIRESPCPVVSI